MTPGVRRQLGFSMIEILVAVLLFTISLVGFAGAMAVSLRSTNVANVRTQATLAAQMIEDRMRANPEGVVFGNYAGTFNLASGAPGTPCATGCNASQLAAFDTLTFGQLVGRSMPNGEGRISCALAAAPTANVRTAPRGLCTVQITWGEQAEEEMAGGATGSRTGRFDWVFNP